MHTQSDTLKILGCSRATLHRYVQAGKIAPVKKGGRNYYDEHEVAALVPIIAEKKKIANKPVKDREPIPISEDAAKAVDDLSANSKLDKVGLQYLSEATRWLDKSGLLEDCDRHMLLDYAIHAMLWQRYVTLAMDEGGVTVNASGSMQAHPYHRIAIDHHRQMLACSDRLGLNPKARSKLEKKQEVQIDELDALIS